MFVNHLQQLQPDRYSANYTLIAISYKIQYDKRCAATAFFQGGSHAGRQAKTYSQFLYHRPHRPRINRRWPTGFLGVHGQYNHRTGTDGGSNTRQYGSRARTRHHHQGAKPCTLELQGRRRARPTLSTSSTPPATWTLTTRSPVRARRLRGGAFSSWTPPRVSRPRRWPMVYHGGGTRPGNPCLWSTRIDLPSADPDRS